MSHDADRKLLGLLDSLSPDHVQRLKTLADARTATPPAPPTDGLADPARDGMDEPVSTNDAKYRVLYTDADGHEQLTGAMSCDAAFSRAKALEKQGHTVGSVMDAKSAEAYMQDRYAPTYRGVKIPDDMRADGAPRSVFEEWKRGVDAELDKAEPKPVDENPFAPDLTMSREVADYVLRAVTGLLEEGYWPKAYTGYGPNDSDERDYDEALVLKAADIVGRENIKNSELLGALADWDEEAGR